MYSVNKNLEELPLKISPALHCRVDILSPPGEYYIDLDIQGHYAEVIGVSDGFDPSLFTFNLSNLIIETTADISQDNLFEFEHAGDSDFLSEYDIKTHWDIEHEGYLGGAWKISLSYGEFEIDSITPDNKLVLRDPDDLLPSASEEDLNYTLLTDEDVDVLTEVGNLTVTNRGRVSLSSDATIYEIGHYLDYDGDQYKIIAHNPDDENEFYIGDYDAGDVGSATIQIYKRLLEGEQGQFVYSGWTLDAGIDLEAALEIQNGINNPPAVPLENGRFKENYLILNNSEYYIIQHIVGNLVTLSGPPQDWTLTGTSDTFSVYRFDKKDISIASRPMNPKVPGFDFVAIDREGNDIISRIQEDITPLFLQSSLNNNGDINEAVKTKETIKFKIEYKDGNSQQGEI